jgi:hypothetical protein
VSATDSFVSGRRDSVRRVCLRRTRVALGDDAHLERVRRPAVEAVEVAVAEAAQRDQIVAGADARAELPLVQNDRLGLEPPERLLVLIPRLRSRRGRGQPLPPL